MGSKTLLQQSCSVFNWERFQLTPVDLLTCHMADLGKLVLLVFLSHARQSSSVLCIFLLHVVSSCAFQ